MNSKVPGYMYEKSNIIRLILLTAAFALLFINIFQPFNSRDWYPDISEFKYFFFSSLIILTGMLVVVISRMIMHSYTKKHDLFYWQYALYVAGEVLAMSLFYTLFAKFVPRSGAERDVVEIFYQSTKNTGWVLYSPTLFCGFTFHGARKTICSKSLHKRNLLCPKSRKSR